MIFTSLLLKSVPSLLYLIRIQFHFLKLLSPKILESSWLLFFSDISHSKYISKFYQLYFCSVSISNHFSSLPLPPFWFKLPLLHTWIMTLTLPNLPAFTLFSLQCIPLTATWWSLITREWLCHSSIQNRFAAAHLHQSMGQHVYTIPARPLGLNLLFLKLLSFPSYHSTHPVYLLVLKQSKQYPSSGFLPFLLLSWKNFPQISVWLFFLFQVIA